MSPGIPGRLPPGKVGVVPPGKVGRVMPGNVLGPPGRFPGNGFVTPGNGRVMLGKLPAPPGSVPVPGRVMGFRSPGGRKFGRDPPAIPLPVFPPGNVGLVVGKLGRVPAPG